MKDSLEKDIRSLFCNNGPLDRDEVTMLLLQLLDRIKKLEDKQEGSEG